jgi:hypothetical protein
MDSHISDSEKPVSSIGRYSVIQSTGVIRCTPGDSPWPLLFLLYINDLPECVSSTTRLFADDCVTYRILKSEDDTKLLQKDIDALQEWETKWMMSFNPSKCNVLRFCPKQKEIEGEYSIHGTELERVTHTKYLGVCFDQNFKWTSHVDTVVKKASQMLGFVLSNIHSCPKSFKEVAYKSLVRPHQLT